MHLPRADGGFSLEEDSAQNKKGIKRIPFSSNIFRAHKSHDSLAYINKKRVSFWIFKKDDFINSFYKNRFIHRMVCSKMEKKKQIFVYLYLNPKKCFVFNSRVSNYMVLSVVKFRPRNFEFTLSNF